MSDSRSPTMTAGRSHQGHRGTPHLPVAAFVILAILCGLYFAWPIWRAFFPLEIDFLEPWNAFHADEAAAGQLYHHALDNLVVNNYPPLSFYAVDAIASATGFDAVYVGRILSIAATLAIALAAAALVRRLGASVPAAGLAGLWFLATMARFFDAYVGMNDPNLPALAIMAWALVWLMRRLSGGQAVEPAILLMVVAGFYKHNVVAIPLTALIWLALVDPRQARRAIIVGVGAVVFGFAICGLIWGSGFFAELLTPRIYNLRQAVGSIGRLQWIAPALAVFAIWAPYDWRNMSARFAALFIAIAFVVQCVEKLGEGVADNAQFELIFAAAIGLGLAYDRIEAWPLAQRWGVDRMRVAIVVILIGRLLASANTLPYRAVFSPAFRTLVRQHAAVAVAEAARVSAIPGEVACSISTVCRFAGKSYQFDSFNVDQKIRAGKLTQEELNAAVAARHLRFEAVDVHAFARFQ